MELSISRFPVPLSLAAATMGIVTHAAAIVYERVPSDEEMVDWSSPIVFGEVVDVVEAAASHGTLDVPATDVIVRIAQRLKGVDSQPTTTAVVVRQLGGEVADGVWYRIAGLPMLTIGQRVLLFLGPADARHVHETIGMSLGVFYESSSSDHEVYSDAAPRGTHVLLREPALREPTVSETTAHAQPADEMTTSSRDRHEAHSGVAQQRDSRLFRSWIVDRVQGIERQKNYLVSTTREATSSPVHEVKNPYKYTRAHKCGGNPTPPSVRWQEFERNPSRESNYLTIAFLTSTVPSSDRWYTRAAIDRAVEAWSLF